MENTNYQPRFYIILLFAVLIGQIITFNYLKSDFESRISQCYEAINANSIMQGALVNILEKNKTLNRDELLAEAEKLSTDLRARIEQMQDVNSEQTGVEGPQNPN